MELAPLKRMLSLEKTNADGLELYKGSLAKKAVVAIVTGMGTDLATKGLERLLGQSEVERVIVVGITGAVDNETPIGTLVVPEVVMNGDSGAEFQPEQIGAGTPNGKMRTSDVFSTDPDLIAALRSKGVVSLDMETAAIAEVCERRRIPWSVFRAISDRATDGSVDDAVFHLTNQDGTPNVKAVVSYFLKHPGRIPAMARLARGAKLATGRAAEAAVSAVSHLYS